MRSPPRLTALALAALLSASVSACIDSQPVVGPAPSVLVPLTWDCSVYDCGNDPEPMADGIYVGDGINPKECGQTFQWSDTDGDGIADPCERELARAFAPMMRSHRFDDVRGESYWAVQFGSFRGEYRIAYLLGYYWDHGTEGWYCDTNVHGSCLPHVGDSEWVAVDIEYDANSKHWLMKGAYLSAHWGKPEPFDRSDWVSYRSFEFPAKSRGYPLVWVSRSKHANYESASECEAGTDSCWHSSISDWRVEVVSNRNIGSRLMRAPNSPGLDEEPEVTCRYSVEDFAGNGAYECFWPLNEGYDFNGWQHSLDNVTAYGPQLKFLGF